MEQPSAIQVYSQSWAAARAVLARRPRFYWAWIAAAAVVGALSLLVPDSVLQSKPGEPEPAVAIFITIFAYAFMVSVLAYFVLADAVRTMVAAFAMTVPVFFLMLVINMATSMAVQIAMYFLVIPAFYVGPKMWLWAPNYLLESVEKTDLGNTLVRAWLDTNNLYWPTLGLMALVTLSSTLIIMFAVAIAAGLIQLFHPIAILTTPLLVAVTIYLSAQIYWAWLQWAVVIRRHADALAAPVVA